MSLALRIVGEAGREPIEFAGEDSAAEFGDVFADEAGFKNTVERAGERILSSFAPVCAAELPKETFRLLR